MERDDIIEKIESSRSMGLMLFMSGEELQGLDLTKNGICEALILGAI